MKAYYALLIFFTSALLCSASTVLVREDFSSIGPLNGRTPDTCELLPGQWRASSAPPCYQADGTALLIENTATRRAMLELGSDYLQSNPGVYTASMEVQFSEAVDGSESWVGLGFCEIFDDQTNFAMTDGRGGSPWMLLRANGAVEVFGGVGAAKTLLTLPPGSFPEGKSYTLKLVLHADPEGWSLTAFVGDQQLDLDRTSPGNTYSFSTKPVVRYVGISNVHGLPAEGLVVAAVRNFQIVFEPEN